jgi:heterotetrameric sarcosine oxidase gamma subunit
MPDLQSPLAGRSDALRAVVSTGVEPQVVVTERPLGALTQLAGWGNAFVPAIMPALTALGIDAVGDYRAVTRAGAAQCLRVAPDRVLLRHPDAKKLETAIATLDPGCVANLDLSHARCVIRICGPSAVALLARVGSIDFRPNYFGVGQFIQTGLHHVGVLIHRTGSTDYDILIPTTWAASLWDFLCDNAAPLGYRVGD